MADLLNPGTFRRWLICALALPLAGALAFAGILVIQIDRQNRTAAEVDRKDLIIGDEISVLKDALDQETGLRGYRLTGDRQFLESYTAGSTDAEKRLRELQSITRSNPEERQQTGLIQQRYQSWKQHADRLMQADGGRPWDHQSEMHGKQLMDSFRAAISAFILKEEDARQQSQEQTRHENRQIYIYLGSFSIIFAVLLGWLAAQQLRVLSGIYARSVELLDRHAREVQDSRQWLATVLASIGDGVIATNARGEIVFANPSARRLTGWDDMKGRPLAEVFKIVREQDHMPGENPFEKVRRLGAVIGLANHTALIRKDGSEIPVADSGAPIRDEKGNLLGVVIVFSDMTERRETERILRSTEQFAALGRLAASIAHEIHNPLDAAGNAIFLMQKSGKLDPGNKALSNIVGSEISKANEISRNVLGLYRQSAAPTSVDMPELIENAVNLVQGKLREKKIQVRQDLSFRGSVIGFPTELRQVLVNLLANAIDASANNTTIEVRTVPFSCELAGGKHGLLVEVKDEGSGISDTLLPRLFQPFVTTKGSSGTGLGLWVSRSIVEKHGGTLTAESRRDGHGAIFRICLPMRVETRVPENQAPTSEFFAA